MLLFFLPTANCQLPADYGVTSNASTHTHDPCELEFRLPVASIVIVCEPEPSPVML
jgi:hypothetical protein